MTERDICERCGKPKATVADCEEADRLDDSTEFDLQFCWSEWLNEPCEDTRLERMQAKLTRLRDAAKAALDIGGSPAEIDALRAAIAESERP